MGGPGANETALPDSRVGAASTCYDVAGAELKGSAAGLRIRHAMGAI